VTASLKKAEETDGRKCREGLQQIVTCGCCCCVFVSCRMVYIPREVCSKSAQEKLGSAYPVTRVSG